MQRKAVYGLFAYLRQLGRETFEYGELSDHNCAKKKGYDPMRKRRTYPRQTLHNRVYLYRAEAIPASTRYEDVAAKEPTCTESAGKRTKDASIIAEKPKGTRKYPPWGHNLSITVRALSRLGEVGQRGYTKCSNEVATIIPIIMVCPLSGTRFAMAHPYDAPAPRTGIGGSYSTCNREGCDYSSKSDRYVEKALGHNFKHHEAKQADCCRWEEYDGFQRGGLQL